MMNQPATLIQNQGNGPCANRHSDDREVKSLRTRVRELETLCAGVYVAAVELGLPQPLLNGLWTVAGRGNAPRSFDVDLPPRVVPAAPAARAIPASPSIQREPLPDVRLIDRPPSLGPCSEPSFGGTRPRTGDARPVPAPPELKPLPVRRTVLVVDDDPMMLEVLVRILQRENYEIVQASSGPEALGRVSGRVDLLITDYSMPQMHGRELARRVRERMRDLPVLYQTGFSDLLFEDRKELEEGAAFLEKPFTARGLREAVRFMLFGALNPQSQLLNMHTSAR